MQIESTMTLARLLEGIASAPEIAVRGIASDSRKLEPGFLFLAREGIGSHGLDYLHQAYEAGVCAIAWDSSSANEPVDIGVPLIAIDRLGDRLGEIANRFYAYPSKALDAVGITGTNGKTTVAWLLAQCMHLLNKRCAYLGTLGHGVDELQGDADMTTPDTVEMHERLAGFLEQGASHAAIEVSSHALSQHRIDGVVFDAVLFTNLTRDHLDYHGDMQSYFEAKARLFLDYDVNARIVNLDSEFGAELAARCGQEVITVSTNFDRVANGRPYLFIRSVVATAVGSNVTFTSSWGDGSFRLPIPGNFNVANAAIVLAYLLHRGFDLQQVCDALGLVSAPPGRMQSVPSAGPAIYIDYAHTPDAIESALRALRPHCRGKLWCVFGCGGDRDRGKRPLMGRLAERLADRIVVTNDNPRNENPASIIDDIVSGLSRTDKAIVIEERAAAIAWTIANASPADAILVAGKGHENYQEIAGHRLPFSDYAVASAASGVTND
ncbi:MAG TPA: UDP-N-acetylmuramoyl-L-alanyl-D-glutamate--2,6-diaminopimelate ligase [Woeseiaceae bacterium]|nr:UDP-N-acetylmuramoyl-L-alanyl-D-glutamate--2,6-diaminopimelate ligase [Woeseiaceae bacterium]